MGLCKEGILHENEVSAFRTHLLETLTASPFDHDYEPSVIIRDKLIFLQELLYAKCISEDEYHASKRPLLQRLALQGAEIGARDVIVGAQKEISKRKVVCFDVKEDKLMYGSTPKKIKGAASVSGFVSSDKNGILDDKGASDSIKNSIKPRDRNASTVSLPGNQLSVVEAPVLHEKQSGSEKGKKKPFRALFQRDQKEGHGSHGNEHGPALEDKENVKSVKKTWGFDGFRKWKRNDPEDETTPLSVIEKSDDASYTGEIVQHPTGKDLTPSK
ncbi:UNVERIFIED_CONTAM: hypothetical protein Slati_1155400 [Sesamum latifolium]|uniref:Uncharacterized protein n=1 Tax=Sesamum latifolium TaxID=2727402 RepID=A0AAW2XDL8_9LAMI